MDESDETLAGGYALSTGGCMVSILAALATGPVGWVLLGCSVALGTAGFVITSWYRRTVMQQFAAFCYWGTDRYETTSHEYRWAGGTLGEMGRSTSRQINAFHNLLHEYSVARLTDSGHTAALVRSQWRDETFDVGGVPALGDLADELSETMPFVDIWYRPASLTNSCYFLVGFAFYEGARRVGVARVKVWPNWPEEDESDGTRRRIQLDDHQDRSRFTDPWVWSGGETPENYDSGYNSLVVAPVFPSDGVTCTPRIWVRVKLFLNSGGGQVPTDGRGVGIWLDQEGRRSSIDGEPR